ncbi:hypothetical protein Mapa_009949 [Marchantia paleacea]|nr:hypothetical protein Mapa_009949 [Marchantia paleacea]
MSNKDVDPPECARQLQGAVLRGMKPGPNSPHAPAQSRAVDGFGPCDIPHNGALPHSLCGLEVAANASNDPEVPCARTQRLVHK